MKHTVLFSYFFFFLINVFSQKKVIESSVYGQWPSVERPLISDDGKYVMYKISGQSSKSIVQSLITNWKKENVNDGFFTSDSKKIIFQHGDTLFALKLGTNNVTVISNKVSSFKVTDNKDWLSYYSKEEGLVLINLITNSKEHFFNVKNFWFNEQGTALFVEALISQNGEFRHSLDCKYLINNDFDSIWAENVVSNISELSNYTFNDNGDRLAFIIRSKDRPLATSIWYYNKLDKRAKIWISNETPNMPKNFSIDDQQKMLFNKDGDGLFIKLKKEIKIGLKNSELASVDVWNYKDERIQPDQISLGEKYSFTTAINRENDKILILEDENDEIVNFSCSKGLPIGKFLITRQVKHSKEFWWHREYSNTLYLISTKDGSRMPIFMNTKHFIMDASLSPSEKFVTWYDTKDNQYSSYEISTRIIRNISSQIPFALYDDEKNESDSKGFGIVGWMQNDDGYLIYDRFDIWNIDPTDKRPPLNVTNNYGRNSNIVLGVANNDHNRVFSALDRLLLSGFNRKTKENGFFIVTLKNPLKIQKGKMGPYTYCIARTVPNTTGVNNINDKFDGEFPIKSKKAEVFIVRRMSAEKSPNYFFTKDFLTFKEFTNVYPEKDYNWLTSELLSWQMYNGNYSQGILYKPENFDSTRKYPIIFYYYQEKSDGLHMYMKPDYSFAIMNIPQYVSNGYLVFVPDIYYMKGHPGQGAMNAVISASRYLSTFSWVDSTKLGIMGQSFGGFETNYIVTHSNVFSAACSGSGPSDMISMYGGLFNTNSAQRFCEVGQMNLGSTLWQHPEIYIENSPIFYVDKVTTPLLIWQGKDDGGVRFEQAVEMFLNMRRAGKKVWLLQYNEATHALFGKNAMDLDIRMRQFFDYYLKNSQAPIWMVGGVPAKYKQIKTGFETDTTGLIP